MLMILQSLSCFSVIFLFSKLMLFVAWLKTSTGIMQNVVYLEIIATLWDKDDCGRTAE